MFMIMKKWRIMRVNKEEIIENMIQYIEEEERNLQAARMSNDSKAPKTDIVNGILNRLEKEINHEN